MTSKNMILTLAIISAPALFAAQAAPKPQAHSGAAVASVVAVAQSPKFVSRTIRFGRPQLGASSMCVFELSAHYNVNEAPTVKTSNGKIPATLWDAIHDEIQREQLPCVQNDPSVSQDAAYPCFGTSRKACTKKVDKKMAAEALEVFVPNK